MDERGRLVTGREVDEAESELAPQYREDGQPSRVGDRERSNP